MNTREQQQDLPAELTYSEEDLNQASARKVLAEGVYRFVVVGVKKSISKIQTETDGSYKRGGNFSLSVECAPLDADNTPKRPTIFNNVTFPIKNPGVKDHKVPDTIGLCVQFLSALGVKGITAYPKKAGVGFMTSEGEVLDLEGYNSLKRQINTNVMNYLKDAWKSPEQLIDETFYGQVAHNGEWRNITKQWSELPEGEERKTSDFVDYQ